MEGMTMTDALLPCPFCGERPLEIVDATRILGVCRLIHRCTVMPTMTLEASTPERVLETWNRRAQPVRVKVDIEREAETKARLKLRSAFRKALADLPEIAPAEIASVLSSVHMRDEFFAEGKRLQSEHGTDLVAPRVEQECGAGAWSLMRKGILSALASHEPQTDDTQGDLRSTDETQEPAPVVITDAMVERAKTELLAHGVFSYLHDRNEDNGRISALAALQAALTPNGGSGDE